MHRISLTGPARRVGQECGALIAPALGARLQRVRRQARAKGLDADDVRARVPVFADLLARVAPHWLREIDGIAAAAGIAPSDLLALNCLPDDFWDAPARGNECTSYLAIGSASRTGESLLHKNRDERDWRQNVHVKQLEGTYRYLAGVDIGNIGIAQFVNKHGLCGANNTGSHIPESETNPNGLGDCLVTRLLAEQAQSCADALELLEDLIARGLCGGAGPDRGTIYLFADRDRGLIVENTSRHLDHQWIDDGLGIRSNHFVLPEAQTWIARAPDANTLRRYQRACQLIQPRQGEATSELFAQVSRDHSAGPDSICSDNSGHFWMTLSAFTHAIRREHTDTLTVTWVCNGHTRNACYFPMHLAVTDNAADLVSGEHNAASWRAYEEHGCGDHLSTRQGQFESAARPRTAAAELQAIGLLRDGKLEEARILLAETDHELADQARVDTVGR